MFFSIYDLLKIFIFILKNVIENYEGEGVGFYLEVVVVEFKLKIFFEEGMVFFGKNIVFLGKCIFVFLFINNGYLIFYEKFFLENMV